MQEALWDVGHSVAYALYDIGRENSIYVQAEADVPANVSERTSYVVTGN